MTKASEKATDAPDEIEGVIPDESVSFSDTELRGISSFDDAVRLAESRFGSVVDASDEIGSGFVMLEDKSRLVGETFVVLSFTFPEGDYRDENGELSHFAVVRLVTQHGDRFVVTDGGHGIYSQLDEFAVRSGRKGGLMVKGGLRKSEYEYLNEKGISQPAVTYYLNV